MTTVSTTNHSQTPVEHQITIKHLVEMRNEAFDAKRFKEVFELTEKIKQMCQKKE